MPEGADVLREDFADRASLAVSFVFGVAFLSKSGASFKQVVFGTSVC